MYMFESMVDLALNDNESWKSDAHRDIAVKCLIQNPRVFTRDKMLHNGAIINGLSDDQVKEVTVKDLLDMGCDFI